MYFLTAFYFLPTTVLALTSRFRSDRFIEKHLLLNFLESGGNMNMLMYIRNTLIIFWADLWIRGDLEHWSFGNLSQICVNSFFKQQVLKEDSLINNRNGRIDGINKFEYLISVREKKQNAKRDIYCKIYNRKHPTKTFLLRQLAWYQYSKTKRMPSIAIYANSGAITW